MTDPEPAMPSVCHRVRDPGAQLTVLLASAGFFLITLDILIVNVALTQISSELGGGTVGQQWVVDGYTVLFASLLLSAGNLADRFGAKRALGVCVALFGLTSLARQVGGAMAIAVFGALIADRSHFLPGMQTSLVIAAALLLTAVLAALRIRPTDHH